MTNKWKPGLPTKVIFWHGSSYVIELVFAADATVARIALHPKALLHSDSWDDVPETLELSPAEMLWLIASANLIKPLGDVRELLDAPNGCFQSGKNLYCLDEYGRAVVSHYHIDRINEHGLRETPLKDIEIMYEQSVVGAVEGARMVGSQRDLKVAGHWYQPQKPVVEIFDKAEIGSVVRLVTYGCTPNKNACVAIPAP